MKQNLVRGIPVYLMFLIQSTAFSQSTANSAPASNGIFGAVSVVLSNGNYVIADPSWDNGAVSDVGAVYLYNGTTHVLISTLTGSTANDKVGIGGVEALPNGNYVVLSPNWHNGASVNAGAVTWCNGTTGTAGVVSSTNSLVGGSANNQVGVGGIVVLTSGSNYVVNSYYWDNGPSLDAGAVTWGNGTTGISGVISSSNSLVGSSANDKVGIGGVVVLTNGNYVVRSFNWNNGAASNAGAITWGNGAMGTVGTVNSTNSLVGTTSNDQVGFQGITALPNGNYVVKSVDWHNGSSGNVGATTWGNGTTGIAGIVSSGNSLIGGAN
ncbi:MAG: hypothetical protein QM764_17395 [Chitinophagaceae bacterium]